MLSLGLGAASAPAWAHHSFAMYDHSRTLSLQGVVEDYQWTNPHGYNLLEVSNAVAAGVPAKYLLECTSINMMSRKGWSSRTLKAGDKVAVTVSPLRNGDAGGLAIDVTLPTGKTMETGVPNASSFKRTPTN
jgi:hypothetical protein